MIVAIVKKMCHKLLESSWSTNKANIENLVFFGYKNVNEKVAEKCDWVRIKMYRIVGRESSARSLLTINLINKEQNQNWALQVSPT